MLGNGVSRVFGAVAGFVATLASAGAVQAFTYTQSDLIVVFVKNNTELILNLGDVPATASNINIAPSVAFGVPNFNNTLNGATWTAFAVRNPNLEFTDPGLEGFPMDTFVSSTEVLSPTIGFFPIGDVQAQLDSGAGLDSFLRQLINIPAVNGVSVFENGTSRAVVTTGLQQSYTARIGLGSNRIANQTPWPTNGSVSGPPNSGGAGDTLPLYEFVQEIDPGTFELSVIQTSLGPLRIVPEPGTLLLLGAGVAGLAAMGRKERR